eukprot:scaffold145369_cov25-Prasinocladus_malaysianus.AAC.1
MQQSNSVCLSAANVAKVVNGAILRRRQCFVRNACEFLPIKDTFRICSLPVASISGPFVDQPAAWWSLA